MNERTAGQESSSLGFGEILDLEQEIMRLEQQKAEVSQELEQLQQRLEKSEKKLESQREELRGKKQEKLAAEAAVAEILKKTEEAEAAYRDQAAALEQQNAVFQQMTEKIDEKSKELQERKAELNRIKWRKKRISLGRKLLPWIGWVSVVIIMLLGCYGFLKRIRTLQGEVSEWMDLCGNAEAEAQEWKLFYQQVDAEAKKAQEELAQIRKYAAPVLIRVNSIYNAEPENEKISEELIASEMRFLNYDFNVFFLKEPVKEATLYIDIYNPDGSMKDFSESPEGHTASCKVEGSGRVVEGWGNPEKSIYKAGTYRLDFIYEDEIIYSQWVEISN